MKSLEEIGAKLDQAEAKAEKRTPISSLPFTITAPGSYYLTDNLTGTAGQNGIAVDAEDVTIDLGGFRLSGPGDNGIVANARTTVRNGTITGWSQSGISGGDSTVVEHIRASNNTNRGISVGPSSRVESCTVTDSGTGASGRGISVGNGSIVAKCIVTGTSGTSAFGIRTEIGCTVIDSIARDNDALNGIGISAGTGSAVIRCEASQNAGTNAAIALAVDTKALDCIVTSNSGANNDGIIAASRALISGCTASANGGDGINVGARCAVLNNLVTENAGDGIEVTGPYNRIEGNNAVGNALIGVKANSAGTSTGNLILRNSAGSNDTANYSVIAGNLTGGAPVTSANSASNTNPHANYSLE